MKKPSTKTSLSSQKLKEFDRGYFERGIRHLGGVDEAGRGPLAGPVVAAAAIVLDFDFTERIDDSKKLSPAQRERAFAEILTKCVISTAVIDRARIDEINIYQATLEAMTRSLEGLDPRPDLVLVDGPTPPVSPFPVETIVNGDAVSFSIACASIAAKVTRDRIMLSYHERYPEYGFDRHKGYGTAFHLEALRRHGPCPIHRTSFGPVSYALQGML